MRIILSAEAASRRAVRRAAEEYSESVETFRGSIVSTADAGWLSRDEKLREHLGNLFGAIVNYEGRPTNTQLARSEELLGDLEQAEERFAALTGAELDAVNSRLTGAGLEAIAFKSREEWDAEDAMDASGSLALGRVVKAKEMRMIGETLVKALSR